MTDLPALIDRLRAELQDDSGIQVLLALERKDAQNLLRILEFVEAAKIETMRGER